MLQVAAFPFGEEGLDGFLAGMSKRWVAHVVSQTGRCHYLTDLCHQWTETVAVATGQLLIDIVAERHAHAGHFERMGQTVVYKHAAGQRKHLRLVLQATEGG